MQKKDFTFNQIRKRLKTVSGPKKLFWIAVFGCYDCLWPCWVMEQLLEWKHALWPRTLIIVSFHTVQTDHCLTINTRPCVSTNSDMSVVKTHRNFKLNRNASVQSEGCVTYRGLLLLNYFDWKKKTGTSQRHQTNKQTHLYQFRFKDSKQNIELRFQIPEGPGQYDENQSGQLKYRKKI